MPNLEQPLSEKSTVQSLAKGFRVLQAFTPERARMTLAEVARAADIDNGTAFRFLNTLVMLGYLSKGLDRRFELTLKCLELGFNAIGRADMRDLARPMLRRLVGDDAEAASLAVLDGAEIVYVERVQAGLARLGIDVRIGSRAPAYSTAVGHVILSHMPIGEQKALLSRTPLVKRTATTLTSMPKLLERLEAVASRGYAFSNEENVAGLRVLAAPILDAAGRAVAAVSVAAPVTQTSAQAFERALRDPVIATGQTLSRALAAAGGSTIARSST